MNAEKHTGDFVEFSDADIALLQNPRRNQVMTLANAERIPKANVRSVILKENKHRLRNTAIGLVAGGAAGLGLGIAGTVDDPANSSGALLGGMSVGALMGAWIGHLIPGRHAKIYVAAPLTR